MSYYTSLSGLKASQTSLSVISNNIANAGSVGFKKSRAVFGDVFAAGRNQASNMIAGSGTRLNNIQQQFAQGSFEGTDKTLDLAIAGEGFFTVRGPAPTNAVTYTRNGAFSTNDAREVIDTLGNVLQLLPVDATTGNVTSTAAGDMTDFVLPADDGNVPASELVSVSINENGLVTATFADGGNQKLGAVSLASFNNVEGLRPIGDSHWQAAGKSGEASYGAAGSGSLGAVRSGQLEHANVDVTEELVALISAQRNFQANAKAIETANAMTDKINNLRT